jgi:heat shock protein HtpX
MKYGTRAALAVALTIGFYALALATAGALMIPLGILIRRSGSAIEWGVALFASGGAGMILWSVLPRRAKFVAPGPLLEPARQPRLHEEIVRIARGVGHRPPDDVYLGPDVNAGVCLRGRRRVMVVGLPLLQVLSLGAFRGVLAHEFGHYHGGDTALGPWIYRTREAIGRTLENLGRVQSILRYPFILYAKLFTRVTQAVSRGQELAADRLAARIVGRDAMIAGLRGVHAAGALYEEFWRRAYGPALDSRCRPPYAEGFRRFVAAHSASGRLEGFLQHVMLSPRHDPADSHPPLAERVKAVQAMALPEPPPADDPPALSLVEGVEALEIELLTVMLGRPDVAACAAIRWEDVGERALRPAWEQICREGRKGLEGRTPAGLPDQVAGMDDDSLRFLGTALGVALARSGWSFEAEPGVPVRLRRGEATVEPLEVLRRLGAGELTPGFWRAECARLGIGDLSLAPPSGDAGWKSA